MCRIGTREHLQELTAFRVDPLQILDQHKGRAGKSQHHEGVHQRARNLRRGVVALVAGEAETLRR